MKVVYVWAPQSCCLHPQWCGLSVREYKYLCALSQTILFVTSAISTALQNEVEFFLFFLMNWARSSVVTPLAAPVFHPVMDCLTLAVSGEAGAQPHVLLLCIMDWLWLPNPAAPLGISSHPPPAKVVPQSEGGWNDAKNPVINLFRCYLSASSPCLF